MLWLQLTLTEKLYAYIILPFNHILFFFLNQQLNAKCCLHEITHPKSLKMHLYIYYVFRLNIVTQSDGICIFIYLLFFFFCYFTIVLLLVFLHPQQHTSKTTKKFNFSYVRLMLLLVFSVFALFICFFFFVCLALLSCSLLSDSFFFSFEEIRGKFSSVFSYAKNL